MKWVCSKCKGINIETKVWCDPNNDKILDSCGNEKEDNWCRDCEEYTEFELINIDEDNLQLKLDL